MTVSVVELTTPGEPVPDQPHQRVAAARLTILEQPVVDWEQAVVPDQDLNSLGEDEFYGYGVDAGTGCFVDAAAVEPLGEFESANETLMAPFEAAEWAAGVVVLADPASGHNLVAFSSGWGDGAYPTWIGRTGTGEVACLVTEFFVIPDDRSGRE